jgi:hypothetical protein
LVRTVACSHEDFGISAGAAGAVRKTLALQETAASAEAAKVGSILVAQEALVIVLSRAAAAAAPQLLRMVEQAAVLPTVLAHPDRRAVVAAAQVV